jgi:hypothetical protein
LLQSLGGNLFFWIVLLDISFFRCQYGKLTHGAKIWADSMSYIRSSHPLADIFHGDVDVSRTPVYPAYLALCRFVENRIDNIVDVSVLLQYVLSLFAVILFYKTAGKFLPVLYVSPIRAAAFILFIFCFYRFAVIKFDFSIGTESLSVSAVIFFTCLFIAYLQKPSFLKAVSLGLGLLMLIMLRPVFAVFLPVIVLFFIGQTLFIRKYWKQGIAGLAATCLTFAMLSVYSHCVWQKCGIFSLSVVSAWNYWDCVIQTGLYKYGIDPNINQMFDEGIKQYAEEFPETAAKPEFLLKARGWKYGEQQVSQDVPPEYENAVLEYLIHSQYEISPLVYLNVKHVPAYITQHGWEKLTMKQQNDYALGTIKANKIRYLKRSADKFYFWVMSSASNAAGVILTCFSAAMLLICLRKVSVQETQLHSFFLLAAVSTYSTVFTSAQDDYERLTLPATSLLFFSWLIAAKRFQLFFPSPKYPLKPNPALYSGNLAADC